MPNWNWKTTGAAIGAGLVAIVVGGWQIYEAVASGNPDPQAIGTAVLAVLAAFGLYSAPDAENVVQKRTPE